LPEVAASVPIHKSPLRIARRWSRLAAQSSTKRGIARSRPDATTASTSECDTLGHSTRA
jgi:hypothetical protein